MQLRGHSVCVVERRRVEGRSQEWNISRGELAALTRLGLLSGADLEATIVSEWVSLVMAASGQLRCTEAAI